MTNIWTKALFSFFVYLFLVAFAGVGVAYLFDKSISEKTVRTVTEQLTEKEPNEVTAPTTSTTTTSPGTTTGSGASTTKSTTGTGGSNTTPTTSLTPTKTTLTASVVAQHSSGSNCWIILSGSVYNISSYSHSGGASHIQCGTDQTSAIHNQHGTQFDSYFSPFLVGALGSQI